MAAIRIGYFEASLKALKDGWEEDSSFSLSNPLTIVPYKASLYLVLRKKTAPRAGPFPFVRRWQRHVRTPLEDAGWRGPFRFLIAGVPQIERAQFPCDRWDSAVSKRVAAWVLPCMRKHQT